VSQSLPPNPYRGNEQKLLQSLTHNTTTFFPCVPARRKPGKKAYMAPELFSGRDGWLGSSNTFFDAYASDCWALGVILYTLLSSHPPFELPDPNCDSWYRFIYTGRWLHPESRLKKNSSIYRHLNEDALQLINSILKPQHQRPNIDEILASPWLRQNESPEHQQRISRACQKLAAQGKQLQHHTHPVEH